MLACISSGRSHPAHAHALTISRAATAIAIVQSTSGARPTSIINGVVEMWSPLRGVFK